ncbi:LLM class flavin-dependent oxidoreductase [Streptomyces sp. NPDC090022]|uniref:LLM class flavin-dependent oxidoreductase n=1 Tax=Streptomyces sp. NPDC090022 TaxID=3365920 RepID=UPI0037F25BCF
MGRDGPGQYVAAWARAAASKQGPLLVRWARAKARQGYDHSHHGRAGNPATEFVPDEIVDRFCLLGPPAAHIEKLRALRDLGIDQCAVYDMHDARETTIDAYGAEIIPAVDG